jgi:oligogalacturonide lyase
MTNATWPPEWQKYQDEQTGAYVTRLTSADCINHPLYYLTNSFTNDGQSLIFASDRAGKMDLYRVSLDDGEIHRLTDLDALQPFSGNVVDDEVYFAAAERLHRLNLETGEDHLIAERVGCEFGEVTVSCDRRWVASLVTRGDTAGLLVARADGSQSNVILEGVRALYHPQFHPTDPEQLIYSADPPDPRMWAVRIDGTDDRCIYRNAPDEWFVHETFLGRTDCMIVVHWHRGLFLVDLHDGLLRQLTDLSVWHIASRNDGNLIVCDTHLPDVGLCLVDPHTGEYRTLCRSESSNQGSQWRQQTPLSAADGQTPGWATMVESKSTETAYGPQWTHPHPSFSPDGQLVAYTSDATGRPQVYIVEVPV